MRIVDQALPADRSAGFFEIHPHDEEQGIAHLVGQRAQPPRIIAGRRDVVNRTGADHDEHSRIPMVEDILHDPAGGEHRGLGGFGHRQLPLDLLGGRQHIQGGDIDVVEQIRRHRYIRGRKVKVIGEGWNGLPPRPQSPRRLMIGQPRRRACSARTGSGSTATGWTTRSSSGKSLWESL